ncbi:MAG: ECF-type sigma factor [Thermomicrobiales bacterium]
MTHHDQSNHTRRLRLLPPPGSPAVAPVLSPEHPVSDADAALLTGIARRARGGDITARDLLWHAFAPKLEPSIRRCGGMTWQSTWTRRDERPWELDDLRQEAWLVFADLLTTWPGEGSIVPYILAYFPWRLHSAMRRLGPARARIVIGARAATLAGEDGALHDAETAALLSTVIAALSSEDAELLRRRIVAGEDFTEIAHQFGVSRRTVARRWRRIQRVARRVLMAELDPDERRGGRVE